MTQGKQVLTKELLTREHKTKKVSEIAKERAVTEGAVYIALARYGIPAHRKWHRHPKVACLAVRVKPQPAQIAGAPQQVERPVLVDRTTSTAPLVPPPGCPHYWLIDSPNGSSSRGVCKFCKEERVFNNSGERYEIKKRFGQMKPMEEVTNGR